MLSRSETDRAAATVVAQADGALRLEGQTSALAAELVARNDILSKITDTIEADEIVQLPITRGMASVWLQCFCLLWQRCPG